MRSWSHHAWEDREHLSWHFDGAVPTVILMQPFLRQPQHNDAAVVISESLKQSLWHNISQGRGILMRYLDQVFTQFFLFSNLCYQVVVKANHFTPSVGKLIPFFPLYEQGHSKMQTFWQKHDHKTFCFRPCPSQERPSIIRSRQCICSSLRIHLHFEWAAYDFLISPLKLKTPGSRMFGPHIWSLVLKTRLHNNDQFNFWHFSQ